MSRSFPILIFFLAFRLLGTPLIPPTDSGYGTNCTPPAGDWEGIVGLPNAVNDVVPDSQFRFFCDPTVSIPGSVLVCPTDGISDCYSALSAACAAVTNFGTITLPAGQFLLSHALGISTNFALLKGATNVDGTPATTLLISNYVASGSQSPNCLVFATAQGDSMYGNGVKVTNQVPLYGSNWFGLVLNDQTPYCWSNIVYQHSGFIFGGTNMEIVLTDLSDRNLIATNNFAGNSLMPNAFLFPTNMLAQIVRVGTNFGTNAAHDTVYFTNDIPFCWSFTNHPSAFPVENPIIGSGVENICFANAFTTAKGTSGGMLEFEGGQYCFAKNIRIQDTVRDGIYSALNYRNQYQNLYLRTACYTDSGDGYGLHYFGPNFGCVYEDFMVQGYRHSLIGEGPNIACGWAYGECIGNMDTTDAPNYMNQDGDYHAAGNLYCFQEGCFFHHSETTFIHGAGSIHALWFRCLWNAGMTNTAANPPWLIDTNYPWEFGQFQGFPNGLPYTQNVLGGFSCEQSNKYSHVIACVMDVATVSNYPTAILQATANNSIYAFRFGWGCATPGSICGGDSGNFSGDLGGSNTFYGDDNFSHITGTNQWWNGAHSIPNSCYLSGKPGWWQVTASPAATLKYPPVTPEAGTSAMLPTSWSDMPPSVVRWLDGWSNNISYLFPSPPSVQYYLPIKRN